ncbi:MAG: HNH endonuclease [Planctomycetes bacterium]|nr:HNH endonuclease [Planctomycetota bacterium]
MLPIGRPKTPRDLGWYLGQTVRDPETDCWQWQGALTKGYGRIRVGGKRLLSHRVIYELMIGPIPEGMELDHLCRLPSCQNPKHLEPVTHKENVRRGVSSFARKANATHCVRGHALTGDNLRMQPNGLRNCKACEPLRYARDRAKILLRRKGVRRGR